MKHLKFILNLSFLCLVFSSSPCLSKKKPDFKQTMEQLNLLIPKHWEEFRLKKGKKGANLGNWECHLVAFYLWENSQSPHINPELALYFLLLQSDNFNLIDEDEIKIRLVKLIEKEPKKNICDTLKLMAEGTSASSVKTRNRFINYLRKEFSAHLHQYFLKNDNPLKDDRGINYDLIAKSFSFCFDPKRFAKGKHLRPPTLMFKFKKRKDDEEFFDYRFFKLKQYNEDQMDYDCWYQFIPLGYIEREVLVIECHTNMTSIPQYIDIEYLIENYALLHANRFQKEDRLPESKVYLAKEKYIAPCHFYVEKLFPPIMYKGLLSIFPLFSGNGNLNFLEDFESKTIDQDHFLEESCEQMQLKHNRLLRTLAHSLYLFSRKEHFIEGDFSFIDIQISTYSDFLNIGLLERLKDDGVLLPALEKFKENYFSQKKRWEDCVEEYINEYQIYLLEYFFSIEEPRQGPQTYLNFLTLKKQALKRKEFLLALQLERCSALSKTWSKLKAKENYEKWFCSDLKEDIASKLTESVSTINEKSISLYYKSIHYEWSGYELSSRFKSDFLSLSGKEQYWVIWIYGHAMTSEDNNFSIAILNCISRESIPPNVLSFISLWAIEEQKSGGAAVQ